MNVKLGNEVGYSIRFEDCTTDRTIIKCESPTGPNRVLSACLPRAAPRVATCARPTAPTSECLALAQPPVPRRQRFGPPVPRQGGHGLRGTGPPVRSRSACRFRSVSGSISGAQHRSAGAMLRGAAPRGACGRHCVPITHSPTYLPTYPRYMTDGMMLREFLGEPDMSSYSVSTRGRA